MTASSRRSAANSGRASASATPPCRWKAATRRIPAPRRRPRRCNRAAQPGPSPRVRRRDREEPGMRALVWHGKQDIRCDSVPDPRIEQPRDAIIRVTSCAICGSDLHLYDGFMPGMKNGDIMGHETRGVVEEVGPDCTNLKKGDRVVIPFTIICGECDQCKRGYFSVCERTNRNKDMADKVFGHTTAGLFGYTHLTGGYAGGQAEYLRVPFADV